MKIAKSQLLVVNIISLSNLYLQKMRYGNIIYCVGFFTSKDFK